MRTLFLTLATLGTAAFVPTSTALACGMYIPPDREVHLADLLEEVDEAAPGLAIVESVELKAIAPEPTVKVGEPVEEEADKSTSALIRLLTGADEAPVAEAPTTKAPKT